jgi:dihydroneopterin triphosphate diphosphatase
VARAPFQVLVILFRQAPSLRFCALQRADSGSWQWIAGGGEDEESPLEAARREVAEETGLVAATPHPLESRAFVPVDGFADRGDWPASISAIPEYAFALETNMDPCLSKEHTDFAWLDYDAAFAVLRWDSNRSAMEELRERLVQGDLVDEA